MSLLVAPPPAAPPLDVRRSAADADETRSARTGVRMTVEEFLGLPEDPALRRWLIDGEVWEEAMTHRSRPHSVCENRIGTELRIWLREHLPGGEVASGEVSVLLPGRVTAVGMDAALFDPRNGRRPASAAGARRGHGPAGTACRASRSRSSAPAIGPAT